MADKKITALTSMGVTDPAGEDFLHIIDYGGGSSPVNKKVSLTNLFSQLNLDTTIYGASKTFEIGYGASSNSALKIATAASATADATVTINDDGNAYTDFLVKSDASDSALKVDAGANTVTVNGDGVDVDFTVNGLNVDKLIHADAGTDVVGIGVATPSTDYLLDVAAVSGKSIKAAGTIDATGIVTATGGLNVGGLVKLNQAAGTTLVGTANGEGTGLIPLTTLVSHLSVDGTTNKYFDLADGVQGQIKILCFVTSANSGAAYVTPTSFDGTNIIMNTVGESVTLFFTNSKWYPIGSTYDIEIT